MGAHADRERDRAILRATVEQMKAEKREARAVLRKYAKGLPDAYAKCPDGLTTRANRRKSTGDTGEFNPPKKKGTDGKAKGK